MANQLIFSISFCVIVYISLVKTADSCKTHADCTDWYNFCCGPVVYFDTSHSSKDRTCTYSWCLNTYCSSDSDCGDPSLCCRSNECVKVGCSGCTENSNCSSGYYCCKKTFPLNQTVCGKDCISQICNSNDDCGGYDECCRSGKCTNTGCSEKCSSNSECDLDKFCCKKKEYTGCAKSCVGEICSSDDDCGGPNECCISNKCVTSGCSGCTENSDCSSGQYCCKKKNWYELNECSADCIGKFCSTNDDCGGPGESCDSKYRCSEERFPSWLIAVIVVSVVVLFVAVGVFVAIFWYFGKIRLKHGTQTTGGTVAVNTDRQHRNNQIPSFNQPLQYQESESQNPQFNNHAPSFIIPLQSHYPNRNQVFADIPNNPIESPSAQTVNQHQNVDNQQFYPQNIPARTQQPH